MKQTLFLTTMLAAALLGSGVANAAGTLYASQYEGDDVMLGSGWQPYDKLVVDTPLTLMDGYFLDLYDGATIEFHADNSGAICSICTSVEQNGNTVYFNSNGDVYNFTFDAGAQAIVAASAGSPITLIQDLNMGSWGFDLADSTTLQLNGAGYGETVSMGGVQFTYVGPKEDGYNFQTGEIGFKGYYDGSHNLSLAHGGPAVPEPATGSLSLLALAGLCARRRRK